MSWSKLCDTMAFHPKVLAAGNEAIGAWARMLSWCSQHALDGRVPREVQRSVGATSAVRSALVLSGCAIQEDDGALLLLFGGLCDGFGADREPVRGALRAAVIARAQGACALCGGPLGSAVHIDHAVPVSRGGKTDLPNLQAAHPACNLRKGARV